MRGMKGQSGDPPASPRCRILATDSGMNLVFVSHPFAGDLSANRRAVVRLARTPVQEGHLPLAPHLLLPPILDEATERDVAMRLCLRMVALGEPTEGMRLEIAEAVRLEIPIVRVERP